MASDDEDKTTSLRLVSENPNAREDRAAHWAKQTARQKLSEFAASLFCATAGSDTEAWYLLDRLGLLLDALAEVNRTSGGGLSVADVKEALRMSSEDSYVASDEYETRRWLRDRGHELIVQGALRLAAHKMLDERPHFGGKHSEGLIADGIKMLAEAKAPMRRPPFVYPNSQVRSASSAGVEVTVSTSSSSKLSEKKEPRGRRRQNFKQADLAELRKAIKANDDKRIKELTSKIGRPPP